MGSNIKGVVSDMWVSDRFLRGLWREIVVQTRSERGFQRIWRRGEKVNDVGFVVGKIEVKLVVVAIKLVIYPNASQLKNK